MQEKTGIHGIIFFNFSIISSGGSLLASIEIFTVGKILQLSADRCAG